MSEINATTFNTTILNLHFNEDQQAISNALDRFCKNRCDDSVIKGLTDTFSSPLWRELADMGVLSAATPEGALDDQTSGALDVCAISEALGRAVFPGPVVATFIATQVLHKEQRTTVMEGHTVVSLGTLSNKNELSLMPFAEQAKIFLLTDGKNLYHGEIAGAITPVKTLGGEPWGRVNIKVGEKLANSERGLLLGEISRAAYLAAAGTRLVKDASEYAKIRKQFGKALGDFQAVAHPLADCLISLTAAETLTRAAAAAFDENNITHAKNLSAGAQLSASRAALKSVYVCHQVFAGIGITLEGPAFYITPHTPIGFASTN